MKSPLTDFGFHRRNGTTTNIRAMVAVCLATIVFSLATAKADHPWFKGYIDPNNGYRIFAWTDWDTPLFGDGIQPDLPCLGISPPAYRVDGHVVFEADGTGYCTVIESTGSHSTLPGESVGTVHPVSIQFAVWCNNPSGPPASDTRHDWDEHFLNILSDAVDTPFVRTLVISCTPGGAVISPGEGTFLYTGGQEVILEAQPAPLFVFGGWRGGLSANRNPYALRMDVDYTIRACFESILDVLYVDDNAPGDPGPGDPSISDPCENGTPEHPFDMIQEAIDVAKQGATVVVRPGTYLETIDLLGKSIEVNGLNEDQTGIQAFPIINGQGKETVVRCTQREDPNCTLVGFVITGGRGRLAGGILCVDSDPNIMNCLIVGNRTRDPSVEAGGGVYCQDSNAVFTNCTISGNCGGSEGAGLRFKDSSIKLTNSIVWGNSSAQIIVSGLSQLAITYSDGAFLGTGNLQAAPLFAGAGYWANPNALAKPVSASDPTAIWVPGDYHLRSQAGRWDQPGEKWVKDTATSPCIDAGDPASTVGAEPQPNGSRINMGAYGGTNQASKSSDK